MNIDKWFEHVFKPYGNFVFVENFGWATIITAVVTTILLGLFYKPSASSFEPPFMEHYRWPLLFLFFATMCVPFFSIMLMLIMPGLLVIGAGLGLMLLLYLGVRKLREDFEQELTDALVREEQRRREER